MSSKNADGTVLPPDHPDDEAAFAEILDRNRRVVVYFHAEWCQQCSVMDPLVADAAEAEETGVLWVDVERHPAIAARYDVSAVPTFVVLEGGEPTEELVGRQDRSTVEALLRGESRGPSVPR